MKKSADPGGKIFKMIDDFKGIRRINSYKIKMWVAHIAQLYLISAAVSPFYVMVEPHTLPITSLHNRKLVKQRIC